MQLVLCWFGHSRELNPTETVSAALPPAPLSNLEKGPAVCTSLRGAGRHPFPFLGISGGVDAPSGRTGAGGVQ